MGEEQLRRDRSRALARLEVLAQILDSKFRIPYTNVHFGVDALLGLIPFYGDLLGFIFSFIVVVLIAQQGVSGAVLVRICLNSLFDFLIGIVPVFGDIADVFFKANIRNVALARKYFESPRKVRVQSWLFIGSLIAVGVFFIAGIFAGLVWLTMQLYHLLSG